MTRTADILPDVQETKQTFYIIFLFVCLAISLLVYLL